MKYGILTRIADNSQDGNTDARCIVALLLLYAAIIIRQPCQPFVLARLSINTILSKGPRCGTWCVPLNLFLGVHAPAPFPLPFVTTVFILGPSVLAVNGNKGENDMSLVEKRLCGRCLGGEQTERYALLRHHSLQ